MERRRRRRRKRRDEPKAEDRRIRQRQKRGDRDRVPLLPLLFVTEFFSITRERYTEERKERRALLLPLVRTWREEEKERRGRVPPLALALLRNGIFPL